MKILYYTDQTYKHGGIERVLANKINYLAALEGYEVYLLTTEQKNKEHCYAISNKLIKHDLGINYYRETSFFHPKNLLKIPKHYFKLKRKLQQINPDIVITPHYDFSFYFLPFLHKKSKKLKEYHSSRFFEDEKNSKHLSFFNKIRNKFTNYIETKFDKLILLTSEEQKHYNTTNTVVIPNGIEIISKNTALLKNKRVISAGRIAPVKGFDKLIDAWKIVAKSHPNWYLEIYGEGEKKDIDKLQKQINNLNLQNKIGLCGQTKDLTNKMLESSIYVMSSKTESFPMVLLEAQAVGLPIVSFNCPYGPQNIITNNLDGFLVEDQNTNKLAQAIIQLIENKDLRLIMGEKAKNNIGKLSQEVVMKKWTTLFKEIKNR